MLPNSPRYHALTLAMTLAWSASSYAGASDSHPPSHLQPVGLVVVAHSPGCPEWSALVERTTRMLGQTPFVPEHPNPRIEVAYFEAPEGFGAELRMMGSPDFTGVRRLDARARVCGALLEPLALIIAMTLEDALAREALAPSRDPTERESPMDSGTALGPETAPKPGPDDPWHVAVGPLVTAHLAEAPGPMFGGGVGLRLARGRLALGLDVRLGRSVADDTLAGLAATRLAARADLCWAPGIADLCAGFGVGMLRFDAALTPLTSSSIVAQFTPMLSAGLRIDTGLGIFRAAFEVGVPVVRARVTIDRGPLWTAPELVGGLSLTLLFDASEGDDAVSSPMPP